MSLIGLGGFAMSGKDSVADRLRDEHGWIKTYMSAPLEKKLLGLNPLVLVEWALAKEWEIPLPADGTAPVVTYRHLHRLVGYDESKRVPMVRSHLQYIGTEIGRAIDPNAWVRLAFQSIDEEMERGHSVALTGIRFRNELEHVTLRGGLLVWVERPGYGPVNGHSSDNSLNGDDFDVVLRNDGSLADLHGLVDRVLTSRQCAHPSLGYDTFGSCESNLR